MPVDQRLLDILCCPVSKVPVLPLSRTRREFVNRQIDAGAVLDVEGRAVSEHLDEGLITRDARVIYRVEDGIPVMLPDAGIGTTQFSDFPS